MGPLFLLFVCVANVAAVQALHSKMQAVLTREAAENLAVDLPYTLFCFGQLHTLDCMMYTTNCIGNPA